MKRNAFIIIALLLLIGCGKRKHNEIPNEKFTDEIRLKTTPVKDQGTSSLCWAYAMLATIETEHLMQGDSVNLSVDFVARAYLEEQAKRRLLLKDKGSFLKSNSNGITTRGMSSMLLDLIHTYGIQNYDAYHRKEYTKYDALARKLNQAVMSPGSSLFSTQMKHINEILDQEIGYSTKQVFMYGAVYTPQEFARSVCRDDEYTAMTSFSHHPFGEKFPLEVPDNYFHNTFLNVPIDTLMQNVEKSIRKGHPVCWEGDVSEDGFSFAKGIAITDKEFMKISQELRQDAFETHKTTDDHCMEIVGIARDSKGKKFFICKNSWGTNNRFNGFMYLSYNYVRLKTIAVYIPVA